MAVLASFYAHHSKSISKLRLSDEYLFASTAAGTIHVLDLNCRHTGSSGSCEHHTTIEVGEMWDFDCHHNTLITANHDNLPRVWNASTGLLQHALRGHSDAVKKVLIVDPTMAVSSSQDHTVIVWDLQLAVPEWTFEGHGATVECLMKHGDRLYTGARNGIVAVWDLHNGRCVHVLEGHSTPVWSMAVHPEGTSLATGASGGGMRIWDVTDGYCVAQCEGHNKIVTQFASVPDNQLMTSAADGSIRVWDWATGRHLSTFTAHENAVRGFFLANRYMVSGGMDGRVRVWNRTDGSISHEMREKVRAVWHFISCHDVIALALFVEDGKHLIEVWDTSVLG